ncbi:Calx-beta domain-containing protein [Thiolapillus sp.]|uniref:Calx-beta domain-containing protein n=1 Tax=Thiolapillus sp. TaxID=2017437 RepID=UPI003AF823D3
MFSLWRKARRENSAASRLLGTTSLRFALHGWQRESPAELPLAQANYDVDETAGSVSVTVNRSSSSAGQVSVGYATVDNTAMSGSDYVSSSGTLTLQNGETSKSLNISIDDDAKAVNTLRWS